MNRAEIEIQLHKDRAWLVETYAALPDEELTREVTPSEHDKSSMWTPLDHMAHLALIEFNFARMVRRHLAGDANPVGLRQDASGRDRSMEEIMASVHLMTEEWQQKHAGKSLSAVIALNQESRAETLKLLSELSDDQLVEKLPGAPWADGTIGGVLAANAGHGRMHWQWVKGGYETLGLPVPA